MEDYGFRINDVSKGTAKHWLFSWAQIKEILLASNMQVPQWLSPYLHKVIFEEIE